MAPLRDFLCLECSYEWEEWNNTPETCPHCETDNIEKLPALTGGYHIKGNNSASTRPKGAGASKGGKK